MERLQKHINGTFSITEPHEPQELEVYLHSDTCNAYHMKGVFLKLEIGTVLQNLFSVSGRLKKKKKERKGKKQHVLTDTTDREQI